MPVIKEHSVNGKSYNIIALSDLEFSEVYGDTNNAINKHSPTRGNNVVIVGNEYSSDILNNVERDAVLASVRF